MNASTHRSTTLSIAGSLFLLIALWLAASPASAHHDEGEGSDTAYILVGDLVPEEAVPGPGPLPAGAFPTLTVDPGAGSLCYDMFWDQFDPVTGMVIRLGYPETFDTIEIDFAATPPDDFGDDGDLTGYAVGCIESEPDLLEFLIDRPRSSHITVYSDDYPQGAAGGVLFLESGPGIESEDHEEPPPEDVTTTVLVTDLVVELVAPDPPDIAGFGDARLEVTPFFDQVCWEINWELDEPVTAIHLHVGSIGEVDPEDFRLDFIQEARTFGGTVRSDFTEGCISVFHLVDFFGLVENPEGHYVDVHTQANPDGALRGQLTQADEFDTALDDLFDEGHPDDVEESGRSPVDYILHVLAALALVGVSVFAIYTFRRARGLYDLPPPAAVATAAGAYALLSVAVVIMLLDSVLAPSGSNVVCSDYDRFASIGLVLGFVALLTGAAAIALAKAHPPLRRVAIALMLGAIVVAVTWVLWVPPDGCSPEGDVEPNGHELPTITSPDALVCTEQERVFIHGDPEEGFAGFATPEEAVAGSMVGDLGSAIPETGDDWLIEVDGFILGRVTVGSWQGDRFVVFDHELCAELEGMLDSGGF